MINFLQQLSKSPSQSHGEKTRQQTIESAFSRMASRIPPDNSNPPSLTTSTSVTDGSSEPTDDSVASDGHMSDFIASNEGVVGIKAPTLTREELIPLGANGVEAGSRTVSGVTLVNENGDSREQLLQESVQRLDEDWELGAMPGENLALSSKDDSNNRISDSMHFDILGKASNVLEKTKSVLGKRGRETVEAGLEKVQALTRPKRSSIRQREIETPSFEGPVKKRSRFSEAQERESALLPPTVRRKPAKRQNKQWLSHGLYIGQDRDFNARLTESRNKLKKKLGHPQTEPQKINSIMPLPMFAGHRTLELGRHFRLPFDVFSPLPPGQPKPDEWKKTQKSTCVFDPHAFIVLITSRRLCWRCSCRVEEGPTPRTLDMSLHSRNGLRR